MSWSLNNNNNCHFITGDGQVSEAEFNKTKDILLKDEDTCEK